MFRFGSRLGLAIAAGALCSVAVDRGTPRHLGETTGLPLEFVPIGENSLLIADLVGLPLTSESLAAQDDVQIGGELTLVTLAIQCALTEEQSVTFTVFGEETTVQGVFRMAPQWADGPCDQSCQEWVSSCMLAKINGYGVQVRLFFNTRADHPDPGRQGLAPPWEYGYPVEEGAFFGNFFTSPPRLYSCRGRGRDPLYDIFRVCTHPGSACKIQSVGPCLPSEEDGDEAHACESIDDHGAFRNCHNRLSLAGSETFPAEASTYDRLTSTYLLQSAMSAGLDAETCFDGTPPDEHVAREPREDVGAIGDACSTDDDCNEASLYCDHLGGPGICTRSCVNTNDLEAEAVECGDDGAMCHLGYDNSEQCVQACRADIQGGRGCPQGQVCTAHHLFPDFAEEDKGCIPFCADDDDCPGLFCDARTGGCSLEAPIDEGLLPDGEPCESLTGVCQGWCAPSRGLEGICGTYINLAETRVCPDPSMIALYATDDDLALCVFKSCVDDTDCTEPLVCDPDSAWCLYP